MIQVVEERRERGWTLLRHKSLVPDRTDLFDEIVEIEAETIDTVRVLCHW